MRLTCVGLGPGGASDLTGRALAALSDAELVVGYTTYLDLVRDDFPTKEYLATPMRGEVERCRLALEHAAAGSRVAVVCSGDPGVYGMAGLLLELAPRYPGVEVEVIPGVTAATGGAAVLGAPLMHDWCVISLSDLMTPWELIERRLVAAAEADLAVVLYNPMSRGRPRHLARACDILLAHRDPGTVCGYVREIGREGQEARVLSLAELRDASLDMRTCVFVGSSRTRVVGGRMVTPRGYALDGAAAGDGEGGVADVPGAAMPDGTPGPVHGTAVPETCGPAFASTEEPALVLPDVIRIEASGTLSPDASPQRPCGGPVSEPSAGSHSSAPPIGLQPTAPLPEVLVFGGTVEGRELVEWLDGRGSCSVVASTATEYGQSLLTAGAHVTTLAGPLSEDAKRRLMAGHRFRCIVDATHPYAAHISESVKRLGEEWGVEVVRVVRDDVADPAGEDGWTSVPDAASAARHLAQLPGRVLLTTGSKDLPTFVAAIPDFAERLFVRVLPLASALEGARGLGIPVSHMVAMQGPFTTELNCALMRQLEIDHLVTKRSGRAGGFEEKVEAARACGVHVVVIDRPSADAGYTPAQARKLLEVRYGL